MSEIDSNLEISNPEIKPAGEPAGEPVAEREPTRKRRFHIEKDGDTFVFKRSHVYAALLPFTFVVGLGVGYLFWGRGTPRTPAQVQAASQSQAPSGQEQAVQRYDIPEDGDPSIGPANAPITIIEFSDYECPFCKRWFNDVYLKLKDEYAGQVRIVFRDFPLSSIHPNAIQAAVAANCAGEQDAYWEYHDRLFSGEQLGEAIYLQYAQDLGLDTEAFTACLESGKQEEEIQGDYAYASGLGVRSTPTFFLNGLPIVGAQPYEVFKQVIEQELAGEIP